MIARRLHLLAIASTFSIAAATSSTWGAFTATYPVRHVHPKDAVALLYVRVPEVEGDCKLTPEVAEDPPAAGQRGVLHVACGKDDVRGKIAQAIAQIDVPPPTLRFHVVILEASRKEGATPALPASELKALEDFRKVMTYRSFRLEGETVLETNNDAQTQIDDDYGVLIAVTEAQGDASSIGVRRFECVTNHPKPAGTGAATNPLIFQTSFTVKRGETIVLGTSASGDTARVVLVTALP